MWTMMRLISIVKRLQRNSEYMKLLRNIRFFFPICNSDLEAKKTLTVTNIRTITVDKTAVLFGSKILFFLSRLFHQIEGYKNWQSVNSVIIFQETSKKKLYAFTTISLLGPWGSTFDPMLELFGLAVGYTTSISGSGCSASYSPASRKKIKRKHGSPVKFLTRILDRQANLDWPGSGSSFGYFNFLNPYNPEKQPFKKILESEMPLSKVGFDKYSKGNQNPYCLIYIKIQWLGNNQKVFVSTATKLPFSSYNFFFPSFVRRLLNLWQLGPWQVDNSTSSSRSWNSRRSNLLIRFVFFNL